MSTTVIEIPEELVLGLDKIGARTGQSRAEIVTEALRTFVAKRAELPTDPGWPRSIGMLDDGDVPHADRVDEWLDQNWHPEKDWGRS
jgi:predicted transcriptional regulator